MTPRNNWMMYILPASVLVEGLHIVIPLQILALGGSVLDVGIAIAFQYAGTAVGSIFWGKIIDLYHQKRLILLTCFGSVSILCLGMFWTSDLFIISIFSGLIGFFIIGKNPITQIMVLETNTNNRWSSAFALTSLINTAGSLIAFSVGSVWTIFFDLRPYFLFCIVFSIAAFVSSLVIGKNTFMERQTIAESIHGISFVLRHMRMHHHVSFPKLPHKSDISHIFGSFSKNSKNPLGFLLLTGFFFYFGSNMFFTIFIPYLKSFSMSDSDVFVVFLIQSVAMLGFFYLVPKLSSKLGDEKLMNISFIPRIIGISISLVILPMVFGIEALFIAILSSIIMVLSFSMFSNTNSVILAKSLPKGFEGRILGLNSFMIGIGIFSASLTSGYVSTDFGYALNFVLAILMIGVSFIFFNLFLASGKNHSITQHHSLSANL